MNDNSGENPAPAADEPSPERVTSINKPRPALVAAGGRPVAIIPRTFDDAYRIGSAAVVGKWAPYGWTKEQATLAILHGAEVGLPPMMSLQKICVINGRPSLWGDAVPAIALATGALEDWSEGIRGEGEGMVAYCVVKRRGIKTPFETTFSVADARRAGLWDERPVVAKSVWDKKKGAKVWKEDAENDSPWYRHPKRMLQMRARRAFRDAFADAFSGLYIAEELDGAPEMRDVTPPSPVIHNPLQDDAEVAGDGREPGDEVPPKRVDVLEGQAARDALTRSESNDGAHVHDNGTVTRPGDVGHPKQTAATKVKGCDQDQEKSCQEPFSWNDGVPYCDSCGLYRSARHHPPEAPLGGKVGSQVDEFDEPVAETPAKPARRPPQDAPKPEVASVTPQAEKSSPAPNGGAPDWRKLRPAALAKLSGADYLAYLAKWTAEMVAAGGVAEALRIRFSVDERDVRNRLGSMLDQDQLAEAKRIATEAFKELGGMS